jgi:DNA repair ATPase RecN
MEFIIKQQESFAESMDQADGRMNALERAFVSIFNIVSETVKELKDLTGKVGSLAEKIDALADAQANTEERLNIFITTVERYISNGRTGESRA